MRLRSKAGTESAVLRIPCEPPANRTRRPFMDDAFRPRPSVRRAIRGAGIIISLFFGSIVVGCASQSSPDVGRATIDRIIGDVAEQVIAHRLSLGGNLPDEPESRVLAYKSARLDLRAAGDGMREVDVDALGADLHAIAVAITVEESEGWAHKEMGALTIDPMHEELAHAFFAAVERRWPALVEALGDGRRVESRNSQVDGLRLPENPAPIVGGHVTPTISFIIPPSPTSSPTRLPRPEAPG